MKTALVTGAAGFIGSHLCQELLSKDYKVVGIDDFSAGKSENIEYLNSQTNKFSFFKKDITTDITELFVNDDINVIFHNAASKKTVCLNNPDRDLEVNAGGTLNLLRLAKKYNVSKFVHASTGSVYGEAQYFPQDEKHPYNPTSFYGVSKLAGERYVNMYHENFNLNTTILRYFHVYGSRQEDNEYGGVVAIFKRLIKEGKSITIFGDGNQQRSFTYVSDVVQANVRASENSIAVGKIYNCASGINHTINQLARMLEAEQVNYAGRQIGDIKHFDVDNSLIKRDLGMEFIDLQEGLKLCQ